MIYLILSLLLTTNLSFAEVAKVESIYGNGVATLVRAGKEKTLTKDELLEKDDEIKTTASTVIIHLYPSGQIALGQDSQLKLSESQISGDEKEEIIDSAINLVKGMLRLKIDRESNQKINQQVIARDVTFGVRGTDFEVAFADDDVDLDVYEGEVEVSSPEVQTFVPEIVKKNEGFRYSKKQRKYLRRQFAARMREAKFANSSELKKRWKTKRLERRERRRR